MKTIFTLFLLLSGAAYSQRTANLVVTITSPASPLVIDAEEVYILDISIENEGPDAVTDADTLKFTMTISGSQVVFPPQGDYLVYQENIASGETVTITQSSTFDESLDDSEFPMCVTVVPMNGANPIADDSTNNNSDCITVQLGSQVGIAENISSAATIYPNPAKDVFYVNNSGNSQLVVRNASGSIIPVAETLDGSVDCSGWDNGIYFVTVLSDEKSATTRIAVLR